MRSGSLNERVKLARCPHPPENVTADILEGDYTGGVQWCRLCGAYRRFSYEDHKGGMPGNFGEWREPVMETLKPKG
jgi:hypothetical protein